MTSQVGGKEEFEQLKSLLPLHTLREQKNINEFENRSLDSAQYSAPISRNRFVKNNHLVSATEGMNETGKTTTEHLLLDNDRKNNCCQKDVKKSF